jgi:MMPL family
VQVLEFRQMGWSDRASVCLAVEKTGNVISAAGLIMSISFAGMRPTLNMSICDLEQAVYCTVLYFTVLCSAVSSICHGKLTT